MKKISQSVKIINKPTKEEVYKLLEIAGRTCYRSEHKIHDESAEKFINNIVKSGHESVIEHINISVELVVDRGILGELTRHRLCSFSVESSRYCNYSKKRFDGIKVVMPSGINEKNKNDWLDAIILSEKYYMKLIKNGEKAEIARSVLPMALGTKMIMTANLREWKHIFKLRCSKAAHPDLVKLMKELKKQFVELYPAIFDN